ncbi:MAG: oligosaccharide repeat unit polymerase [Bacteroidales bacterium]|nr:oligosaccharide repeat unit polymerase [Bacteroidales bacterium]
MWNLKEELTKRNIIEVFRLLVKYRIRIILFICGILFLTILVVSSLPNQYSSKEIAISEDLQPLDLPADIEMMMSFVGIEIPNPQIDNAFTADIYSEVIKSSAFADSLLLRKVELLEEGVNVTISEYLSDYQKQPWWKTFFVEKKVSSADLRELLTEHLKVNFDEKSGLIYIYATMQDPYVAKQVVTLISEELQNFLHRYHAKKALLAYDFYSKEENKALVRYKNAQSAYSKRVAIPQNVVTQSARNEIEYLQKEMDNAYAAYQYILGRKLGAKSKLQENIMSFAVISPAVIDLTPQIPNSAFILVVFLLELAIIAYLEYAAWHTLYTPVFCLALPYTLVLFLTLAFIPFTDLISFYYPSVLIWIAGLPLFALPSLFFGWSMTKLGCANRPLNVQRWQAPPFYVLLFSIGLGMLFILRLYKMLHSSTEMFGTEEFSNELCERGLWGHLRILGIALMIYIGYFVSRKKWLLLVPLFFVMLPSLLYMVKGWLIIPIITILLLKLYTGTIQLSVKLLFVMFVSAFFLFLIVYMLLPAIGNDQAQTDARMVNQVWNKFVHYLTSGTLGFSYDLELGAADREDFKYLFSPFINIFNLIIGNSNMLNPIPSKFLNTGLDYTNTRTFFGTLYLHCDAIEFVICTLGYSAFSYVIMCYAKIKGDLYSYLVYFFYAGLFALGWFEFYMWHLYIIEVPVFLFLIGFGVNYVRKFQYK